MKFGSDFENISSQQDLLRLLNATNGRISNVREPCCLIRAVSGLTAGRWLPVHPASPPVSSADGLVARGPTAASPPSVRSRFSTGHPLSRSAPVPAAPRSIAKDAPEPQRFPMNVILILDTGMQSVWMLIRRSKPVFSGQHGAIGLSSHQETSA